MKFAMPSGLSRTLTHTLLKAQKNAPQILFVGGVSGAIASTVLACRATLKVEAVLDEHNEKMHDIKTLQHKDYPEEDRKQDTMVMYTRTSVKIATLYGPSVALGVASIMMLTKSHNLLMQRNASLVALYTATQKAFDMYRSRVVDDQGVEKDRQYRYGSEITTKVIEDTNGPKKIKEASFGTTSSARLYEKIFDEYNINWSSQPEYRILFLSGQQRWANERLRAKGHLFLNEVYDALGFEHTKAGAVVGWVYKGPNAKDGFVDFGIFTDTSMLALHSFMVHDDGILLDFNVDGEIWNLI